ncbi:protein disulfide-isomerase A5-like [Asterias rubens]|uniref:protein disulfide-isomerase A5-like n=1 Tax=Asterias rubens TaxID=7604 RepID=UPI0014558BC0|nr:protein disulfide-isomerase A5-like [Asterias rubens]
MVPLLSSMDTLRREPAWKSLLFGLILYVFVLGLTDAKKAKLQDIMAVEDMKEFKKILRTRNNVLVMFSKTANDASSWMNVYGEVASEMKGLATLLTVDCSDAKKLCKKLKVSPSNLVLKHYQDGEFNKDYDRRKNKKSLSYFLTNPSGEAPWEEDASSSDVKHIMSGKDLGKLLSKEKKPILVMFYAPWCGHCKKMKPEFAGAATELKKSAVLAGLDVDLPTNYEVRNAFNITGFPTILYFEEGQRKYDFGGERDKNGIVEWMKNPQPPKEPEQESQWSDEESEVIHLLDDSFDSYIESHESVLVMFYAPWCGHCKKMKPEYTVAAQELKDEGKEGVLAAVDATLAKDLAKRFEIKGFPTLKYFSNGEFAWDLNERTGEKIKEFMQDPSQPPPPPPPEPKWSDEESNVLHLNGDNFKSVTKKKKHSLVMFYAPWCGHCKKAKPEFSAAAEQLKDEVKVAYVAVDCTEETSKDMCQSFGVSGYPTIKYFMYGKDPTQYNGGREEIDFVRFMMLLVNPDAAPAIPEPPVVDFWSELDGGENVVQLSDATFDDVIQNEESALVMFFAPWCGHCKKMKPAYSEAATVLKEGGSSGVIAAVDATVHKATAAKYDIRGYPMLKYFKNGVARDYVAGRSTDELVQFMQNPEAAATPAPPAEELHWSDTPSEVNHLTQETFKTFTATNKHVLTMFYAPWCGHCKLAKPAFQETAAAIKEEEGMKLAAVDCTIERDICRENEVKGFPTFIIFSDGITQEYKGGRTKGEFYSFMQGLKTLNSDQAKEEL